MRPGCSSTLTIEDLNHIVAMGLMSGHVDGFLNAKLSFTKGGPKIVHGPAAVGITGAGEGESQAT